MMKSSDRHRSVGCLSKRFALNFLIFIVANAMYPEVFEVVGYMYDVNLNVSKLNVTVGSILLFLLTLATNFKNIIYRHTFDVCVLGIFLPIAVIICQIDSSILFMLYPFVLILVMSLAVRISEASRFIKWMNRRTANGISFPELQKGVLLLFSIGMIILFASNLTSFNFDLVDIYLRTYEIRSEKQIDGFFGYFIGWFILIFFPILLCKVEGRFKLVAPPFALFSAFFIFQAFALKVIFLTFFLVAIFAIAYRINNVFKEYFPQFFFLFVFVLSHLIGLLAYPLLDRFFYVIGLNSVFYIDFFLLNPYRFFEGTKLDFGISSYGIIVGHQIDNAYYGGLGTNHSAGFLPSMFADLGAVGVLLASIAIGSLMALIKSMQSSSESFAYLVMISLAFALMNHSFNMLFLSNGLAFIIIFSVILMRRK